MTSCSIVHTRRMAFPERMDYGTGRSHIGAGAEWPVVRRARETSRSNVSSPTRTSPIHAVTSLGSRHRTNIRPLHDRILIQRLDEGKQKVGGIIIPDTAKEKPQPRHGDRQWRGEDSGRW